MSHCADESRFGGASDRVAKVGVYAVRADDHVGFGRRPVAEIQVRNGTVRFHGDKAFAERDRSALYLVQYRRMQIAAMNRNVASAVFLLSGFTQRQIEQDLARVPF